MRNKEIRPQPGFQEKFVRTNVDFCVGGGVLNCGKAQPLDSLVLTPEGFVRMGDLRVGDVISDTQGGTQVIQGIFPQGKLKSYKITFTDGSIVECSDEHLWKVYNLKSRKEEIIEFQDIMQDTKNYQFPLLDKVYYKERKLFIPPYLLGMLLPNLYYNDQNCVIIKTNDLNFIERLGKQDVSFLIRKNSNQKKYVIKIISEHIVRAFKRYGLLKCDNKGIFIPEDYIHNSYENRIEFIKGFLDNYANIGQTYRAVTYVDSKPLVDGLTDIFRSCGFRITFKKYAGQSEKYMGIIRHISLNDFFTLEEKKHQLKQDIRDIALKIDKIETTGFKYMQCIKVSNPNRLYITNDYIVTHNTFAAVLSVAEPSLDGRFRGLFLRNNLGDARSSGGILDTFKTVYGDEVDVVESGEPRVTFKNSGAKIDVTHVSEQTRDKLMQRFKGRQYDFIYFDEGTGFTWETFTIIFTRNRGTAKWSGKVRMTTNPEKNHWLRKFLDWYIGSDGFIREDREGVIRYFYINGEEVDDVVWGNTKEEVYKQCKISIDRTLDKVNGKTGNFTYKDIIKSFTFYLGKMSENKASTDNNSNYVGSVAIMGGRNAQQLLEGNWNVSPEEERNALITSYDAMSVFENDPQVNGDKWITADLADTGTDNFIALVWDGFHIIDIEIHNKTKPVQNAEILIYLAKKHNISNSHIIFDGIRGSYINDYIPEAIAFISYRTSIGLYQRMFYNLKSECYIRVVMAIKNRYISFAPEIGKKIYSHQNLTEKITILNEFIEECLVIAFRDMPNGKKALLNKKEMNGKLGYGRSMDLLDPIAMRFLPVLEYPYGEELIKSNALFQNDSDDNNEFSINNIYDETIWG